MSTEKQNVVTALKNYLSGAAFKRLEADNPTVASQLKTLGADGLKIGECPKVFEAHFEGNVTGKGHKYAGDTQYERTFCDDFNTGYFLFVTDEGLTDTELCAEALKLLGYQYTQAFTTDRKAELVQNEINVIVKSELRKLDFWFDSARLNSWQLVPDTQVTELPFYPVYAGLRDEEGNNFQTAIGYILQSEQQTIVIDIDTRICGQPIYQRTSISARAAAEKAAKKRKNSIIAAAVIGTLVLLGTVLGYLIQVFLGT